jgi:hypothetical protein
LWNCFFWYGGNDDRKMMNTLRLLCRLVDETFPLPGRFRVRLPGDVAELSRLLTSARQERGAGYLNRPNLLQAYLRYFLPWNVFRLLKLFEGLSRENSGALFTPAGGALTGGALIGGVITDLGSGPLTLPIALWAAFPALRRTELEFRCVDRSAPALEAGRSVFDVFRRASDEDSARANLWKIKTIHDAIDAPIRGGQAKLVCALNVFNETRRGALPDAGAKKAAALLDKLCSEDGLILVMEPGVPQSGAFIAALRNGLLERGRNIAAPCPHGGPCPMPGGTPGSGPRGERRGKAKWCHFAHNTESAPPELRRLSAAAGIPKERAVFSYLLTAPPAAPAPAPNTARVRVVSDAFPVSAGEKRQDAGWGRYGCCEKGLILLTGGRADINAAASGALLEVSLPVNEKQRDGKTGALAVELPRSP